MSIFEEGGPLGGRRVGPNRYEFRVKIPLDADGMVGRECPDQTCSPGYFKVKPGTGITQGQSIAYCPYCRHGDSPSEFLTKAQQKYVLQLVGNEAIKGINRTIREALDLGPAGKKKIDGGLLSLEISYREARLSPVSRPVEEELRRDLTCPHCGLEHAVFGLATWCPDCGTDIFISHVSEELAVVRKTLATVDARRLELGARVAARDIENALEDVVSIFEAVLKAITRRHLLRSGMAPEEVDRVVERNIRNSYQNIAAAAETFRNHVGLELFEGISERDLNDLGLAFEKRHPITHNLGVIDRKYLERVRSGEMEGREIRLSAAEVLRAVDISFEIIRRAYERVFISGNSLLTNSTG
ncbi:MAG: hypothetical protein H5T64_06690 [Chloroflexi bacterium]|nr:hypothetical protein [Chloroflexota bacterium]